MTPEQIADRYLALEPARSVIVEACAGSGKTWMLTARILRILLAGVRPGEILAITYTRKAAREIESRLRNLLAELAMLPEADALQALQMRGLRADEARAQLPRARRLYEEVAYAQPGPTVTTFHGWFARLLAGAPLDSGLAGRALDEAAAGLLDEAWVQLAADCARDAESAVAQSLLYLYAETGAYMTRRLMRAFVERRAEWRVWCQVIGGAEGLGDWLVTTFGAGSDPLERLFSANRLGDIEEFIGMLAGAGAKAESMAAQLHTVFAAAEYQERFERLREGLLTGKGEPRALKPVKAYQTAHGEAGVEALQRRFAELCGAVCDAQDALQDQYNAEYNGHALRVGMALLDKLDGIKQQRRSMDFSDLEVEVDKLLATEDTAAYLQARLDARYKQILLDEFQDTNPLQWRILRGWLDAYAGTGLVRPNVFLVGDPKQSIYRFRRAEPGLFVAAAEYLATYFGAVRVHTAHTFRNAAQVNTLVNEVFRDVPEFAGFTEQTSERAAWPARIEVMPLVSTEDDAALPGQDAEGLRNPLKQPRVEAEDIRRASEARNLAERIRQIVATSMVCDKDGSPRRARYSDVLILTRRKTYLGIYEAALRQAGIPYLSPGRGGLLDTLEAADLMAVLRFLACPTDNLALAHVLRTPAFGLGDDALLALSEDRQKCWWDALPGLAEKAGGEPLQRAVRLLRGWLEAAGNLPAHDLLDRILHESDWMSRGRAVVPEEFWPGICANMEAMLELALNVDGGRYPSLTRFVDELQRLSSSDDEAPDEGLIAAAQDDAGRVRIMTIHGSKGLEAPIVWLIDAHVSSRGQEGYCVAMDWPPGEMLPTHFSLLGRVGEAGRSRARILEAEAFAAGREDLNLLYVAITRAEQVLIVSGVAGRSDPSGTHYRRIEGAVARLAEGELCYGELAAAGAAVSPSGTDEMPGIQPVRPGPIQVGQLRQHSEEITSPAARRAMAFGTAMHAWLEAASGGLPLPTVAPEVENTARKLFSRPTLQRFFDPAQYLRAGNETSFVAPDGSLGRIDRWVEAEDAVWVLDYKSGSVPEDALMQAYREQLATYSDVLRAVFPSKEVRAMLVFTDGGEIFL
jgi:ATP-dependent helicase/nuclease subunit A